MTERDSITNYQTCKRVGSTLKRKVDILCVCVFNFPLKYV